jgi:hypothetical protein
MRTVITILACLLLTSCGGASEDSGRDAEEEKVFDPLIQSVDKAKAVEDTVEQHKKDMDEAVQRIEEGSDDPDE